MALVVFACFFFQAEDGIRDKLVTGVQTCALPISDRDHDRRRRGRRRAHLARAPPLHADPQALHPARGGRLAGRRAAAPAGTRARKGRSVTGAAQLEPLHVLREYRNLAPWNLRDLAALVGAVLDAYAVTPINAAPLAQPSQRTIRFYVTKGLVSPPEGRGTAATYSYRHFLQLLWIKDRKSTRLNSSH